MYIELKTAVPTYIISTYAPTAEAEDIHKNQYYEVLRETVRKLKKKCILYTLGDFNARIQIKQDGTEIPLGVHTLDPQNNLLHTQSDNTADNRNRFITFCTTHNLKVMNTMFPKSEQYKYTYAEPGAKGEPYKRHRYEIIDYILTNNRGRNTIKDVESDIEHGIETRHMPIIAIARINMSLSRQNTERQEPPKQYAKCTHTEQEIYNTIYNSG